MIFCKDLAHSAIFCNLNTRPGMRWLVRVSGFLQSILLKSARKLPRHCVKIESKTRNSVTMAPCMVKDQLSYFWGGCFIYAWQQHPPGRFWGENWFCNFSHVSIMALEAFSMGSKSCGRGESLKAKSFRDLSISW